MSLIKPGTLYPLATKGGEAIPHEVALPMGVMPVAVPASGIVTRNLLPEQLFMLAVTAEVDCFIDFRASPSVIQNDVYTPGVFYVKANTTVTLSIAAIEGASYNRLAIHGMGTAGKVYVQAFSAWGGLGEATQAGVL